LLTIDDQIYIVKALQQHDTEVEKDYKYSTINKAYECSVANKSAPLEAWVWFRTKPDGGGKNGLKTYFDVCTPEMRQQITDMDWEDLIALDGHLNPAKVLANVTLEMEKCDPMLSTDKMAHIVANKGICNLTTARFVIKSIRAAKATKDTFVRCDIQHFHGWSS
jgi:hypothetical protein